MGKGKLILICQSGGKFVTNDDGIMTYTGGEAEAVDISPETTFDDFKLRIAKLLNLDYNSLSLKYFLPGNRRTLITMKQEKDMKRMYEFHLASVTAEVFITGQEGFQPEAIASPVNRLNNIAVGTETTHLAYGNVANVPIQVARGTPEQNKLVDVSVRSRKVNPRYTSECGGLVEIPVTISTNPVVPAKLTSKKSKTKGKKSLVSKQSFIGSNTGTKRSSPPMSQTVVCGVSNISHRSVSKRRRVVEEPSILLQDENVRDTRRRSLRNRGDIQKPVIETDDDDDYPLTDKDDAEDSDDEDVDDDGDDYVDDDKDFVQDIDTYYPETDDLDSGHEMNCSISDANDGSVESMLASWKRCITGVGQGFESVVEFRDALQKYAVSSRFGYRLSKNESNRACGVCLVGGCPWKIYASWVPSESVFRIKKFNRRHTCGGESWKSAHPKKNWVVSIIKERLLENPNQKTKNIADSIFKDFGIELSYCTVRRGIDEAKGGLHTSFKEAYKHLPQFMNRIVEANPGSMVNLVVGEDRRFQRLFLAFQSCIRGFQTGCRPLLFLDAIPFKSRYHEILLTASALDGDDGVLPVAIALVDLETDETWHWFLEQLRIAVPSLRPLTFVSDREKGLMGSVLEIFENAHHGYSIQYLMEDFMRSLRGPFLGDGKPSLSYNLLAAARADRLDGFKVYTEQIRRVSPKAYDWVMQIEPKHWACALFEGEPYSHITSDVGEIYSKWIEETQETLIVEKLVAFVSRIVELVNSSQVKSKQWFSQLVPSKEESLVEECKKASMLKVFFCSDTLFEVHDGSVQLVDISNQTCSCFAWKPTGLPCQHAIAVINRKGRNLYDYCSSFFTVESYRATYAEALNPVAIDLALTENEGGNKEEDEQVLPPMYSRVQGADKRIKDRKRGRSVCCTKCGGVGHNKATCKDD